MKRLVVLVLVGAPVATWAAPPDPQGADGIATRLVGAAYVSGDPVGVVRSLTDGVGGRMAGSPAAERAVVWALAAMRSAGLANVHREPVRVPHWERGEALVEVTEPSPHPIHATALGPSVGTPPGGISAELVEVSSFEELRALGAPRVKGRIVLFNRAMLRDSAGNGYSAVVPLRRSGAFEAAKLGAVAAMVRSVGTGAYRLPHTGATKYEPSAPAIPFVAVAAEDAEMLHRLLAATPAVPVKVRLRLGCRRLPDVDSANVVGEVVGRERPEEVVLIGAHLDSWDLGDGALDDGAGVALVLETARLLRVAGVRPRRTVRVVLFMNEEMGLSGATAYALQHAAELPRHVVALEADSGAGRPVGWGATGGPASVELVRALAAPLAALHAEEVIATTDGGADLIPLQAQGVPLVAMRQDGATYFDWHHTAADTLDKIDPAQLTAALAAFAAMVGALAETDRRLPFAAASTR